MSDELKERLSSVLRWLGVAVLLALFVGLVYWIFYASRNAEIFPSWTGFNTRPALDDAYPARTLWDWLSLLLVPVVLAVGGLLFTWFENRQTRALERERVVENQRIERERAQDAVLESYLDQMTELLLTRGLRTSLVGDEVRSVARARTLTALRGVDGERKGTIVRFLSEARLIGHMCSGVKVDAVLQLEDADFGGAELLGVELIGSRLTWVWLPWADLSGAKLQEADLTETDLCEANLSEAKLMGANLTRVNFWRAKLEGAEFMGANLTGVNFREANLNHADFSHCRGLRPDQLFEAKSLHGATLPDYIDPIGLGGKWSPPKPRNMPEPTP